jgi:hypothetical protein
MQAGHEKASGVQKSLPSGPPGGLAKGFPRAALPLKRRLFEELLKKGKK